MNHESFQSFVDRHGTDESLWPDTTEGKEARQLLEQSDLAQKILGENKRLFQLLEFAMSVPHPVGLEQRILRRVTTPPERNWTHFLASWILKPALVALPLVLGFVLGLTSTDSSVFVENEITATQFDDHSDLLAISDE
ncbi:MAG: hypothetical protein F4X44_04500 [Gammaproteobacteria bacterium]|nr:hypothetical protein [Gammaproteobacteria bacterium]MYD79858.1 hypothetical protein [Gammaproteobacteria bacterium]